MIIPVPVPFDLDYNYIIVIEANALKAPNHTIQYPDVAMYLARSR